MSRPTTPLSSPTSPLSIESIVAVAVGGAVGTAIRHGVTSVDWRPTVAVLMLNVVGSATLGAIVAHRSSVGRAGIHDRWSALLGIGLCGGLTTFSAHVVDVAQQLDDQQWLPALTSLIVTSAFCVVAAGFGFRAVESLGPGPTP